MPLQVTGTRSASAWTKATKRVISSPKTSFACVVLLADSILISLIISYVQYTKIDWDAYMSQVSGFLGGERDYSKLEGDTGPLVYPAGFLYIYSAIQYVTGGQVYPAQILFGLLYLANLGMVLLIYSKTDVVPWWALCLLALSKRVHSIFVLRLFNDCFATTLFHASLISFLYQKWHLGLVIFSGAVSVKMNVLLYAPPLLLLLIKAMDPFGVTSAGAGAALVQIIVGLPFILSHPVAYISRAFNLGRVFVHFWSVNFKFVPEPVFVSKGFALFLLAAHLILLAIFIHYRWCRHEGGLFSLLHMKLVQMKLNMSILSSFPLRRLDTRNSNSRVLRTEHIATTMFVGNFIGIVCARSLHYQFYSWYFYSLPYLLWRTPFPTWLRLILFVTVELCWNVYPSNAYSSALLLGAHLVILGGLWSAPPEYPYADEKSANTEKKAS
ncbi:dolichyl-P-Man:Man(5)GlcNAc(2)-PP-dolichol alpha-1,3-mannosyltransferase [Castilleja foliolosa]|uniref:dolichyl-P-Man:Man5GlcNAc2-PP-dolichol alpha-1,3-mannosyltransferase n=1 Tax=Castilleja foliolosa TaxID=1961234 RepID=A0ABD3DRR9_9LAMI